MAGLDLIPVQDSILAYCAAQFPNYEIIEDMLLDDDSILRQGNKIKPYIVLRWGGLWRNGSKSIASVRYDEYVSTVDVAVVSPTPKQSRRGLNAVMDILIGWEPTNAGVMVPEGSNTLAVVPDLNGRPHAYICSARLSFAVNTSSIGEHISH